jgi:predicted flap endonuclease-1-like 5' DNA nuclease
MRGPPLRLPAARLVPSSVIAYTLLALVALALVIVVAYRVGAASTRERAQSQPAALASPPRVQQVEPHAAARASAADVEIAQLHAFAEERRMLFRELADARAETARYRQIVVDIERNAPPPLLDAPGTPDDLKLIVGIGPVIERMLYQLGIGTYRQIARWSERDIDDVDARLPEFPGRIRRDGWVSQARALHTSKYGSPP